MEQKLKSAQRKVKDESVETEPKALESAASIDDILDDIGSALEENAEEFVRSYVQKGGQ